MMFPYSQPCQVCGKPATQFMNTGNYCAEHGWKIGPTAPIYLTGAAVTATTTMPSPYYQGSAEPLWNQNLPLPLPVADQGSHVSFTFTCPCCQRKMVIDRNAGEGYEQVTVEVLPEE